jgi:hypothetical protein
MKKGKLPLHLCVYQLNDLLTSNHPANGLAERHCNSFGLLSHSSRIITIHNLGQRITQFLSTNTRCCIARAPDADPEVFNPGREVVGVDPDWENNLRNTSARRC